MPAEPSRPGDLNGFFSQDGTRLVLTDAQVVGSIPGQFRETAPWVRVWETRTGRAFTPFRLPTAAMKQGLSVSPDGRRVFYMGTTAHAASLVFNAETGRELVAKFDDQGGFIAGVMPRALLSADGKLIRIAKQSSLRGTRDGFTQQLMIWDGSRSERPATPTATMDDWLGEAHQLTEGSDPARRNPRRAVEILDRAREFYPNEAEISSAYGLALIRAERTAEACAVLQACVESREQYERDWRTAINDPRRKEVPAIWSMRRPTIYFLMALATAESGDRDRAKVWFSWGEACVICPESFASGAVYSIGDREGERARAEPFRQEVARLLGLPAPPLGQLLREPLKFDPMHAGNRMMRVNEATTAETIGTSLWAMEFLLKNSEPEGGILYNAGCFYALSSGKVPARRDEFGNRAMTLLQQASKAGFNKAAVAKTDTDLDPLRGRDDFKQWLADLITTAAKPPEPAPLPPPKK